MNSRRPPQIGRVTSTSGLAPRMLHVWVRGRGAEVARLNENVCAQIERAAKLLRAVAAEKATAAKQIGKGAVPNRPDVQKFVDTAASLEALVKRSRRK